MRCNICVEVCNFDAIAMNNTWSGHELSTVVDREGPRDRHATSCWPSPKSQKIRPWVPK